MAVNARDEIESIPAHIATSHDDGQGGRGDATTTWPTNKGSNRIARGAFATRVKETGIETPKAESGVRFTMRRWNWRAARFEGDYWLTFSEKDARQISGMHGNFWCKHSQNDEFLNWVRVVYELTVGDVRKEIVVRVTSKALVIWNELGHTVLHQCQCRYRQDDASGDIAKWSDFI